MRKSSVQPSSSHLLHPLQTPLPHHGCPLPTAAWPQGCRPPSRESPPAEEEREKYQFNTNANQLTAALRATFTKQLTINKHNPTNLHVQV